MLLPTLQNYSKWAGGPETVPMEGFMLHNDYAMWLLQKIPLISMVNWILGWIFKGYLS